MHRAGVCLLWWYGDWNLVRQCGQGCTRGLASFPMAFLVKGVSVKKERRGSR